MSNLPVTLAAATGTALVELAAGLTAGDITWAPSDAVDVEALTPPAVSDDTDALIALETDAEGWD